MEPGQPLTNEELHATQRIRRLSPCASAWLGYYLPAWRYYLAWLPNAQLLPLRLKTGDGLAEWRRRQWDMFKTPPVISHVTLPALELIERILEWPAQMQLSLYGSACISKQSIRFDVRALEPGERHPVRSDRARVALDDLPTGLCSARQHATGRRITSSEAVSDNRDCHVPRGCIRWHGHVWLCRGDEENEI